MRVPEEKGERQVERISEEIMTKKIPNFMKSMNLYNKEAQQLPSTINQRDPHQERSWKAKHLRVKQLITARDPQQD